MASEEIIEESLEDRGWRYVQDLKRRSAQGDMRAWATLEQIENGSFLKNPQPLFRTDVA